MNSDSDSDSDFVCSELDYKNKYIEKKKSYIFKCLRCCRIFGKKYCLIAHFKKRVFPCKFKELFINNKSTFNMYNFRCIKCDKYFSCLKDLDLHKSQISSCVHKKMRKTQYKFICAVCSKLFTNLIKYQDHIETCNINSAYKLEDAAAILLEIKLGCREK
jgi:hypothetical protein